MLFATLVLTLAITATLGGQDPKSVSTIPAERLSEDWWRLRHEKCVEATKKRGFDVAFLGDSITQGWEDSGRATWDKEFAPLKSANFGFSGDRTEHVLWRLSHGEIVGADPKVIMIMIGTNNIGHGSSNPEQTAQGVAEIVKTLRGRLPSAQILLLGIFPRGLEATDPMRLAVEKATSLFKGVADGKHVHFMDIGHAYLRSTGELRTTLMPDLLHLDPDGYEIWARAVKPELDRLLTLRHK